MTIDNEKAIRAVVRSHVEAYAAGFSDRHLSEVDDPEGTINMKIHNVFIAALGPDIQYYSALARSLDSSLGNMLEKMAINIAMLHFEVSQHVEGVIYQEQTDYIAELLEAYNRYGEGNPWKQGRVRQFFADEELLISSKFWNQVCKSENGYDIVLDELRKVYYAYVAKCGYIIETIIAYGVWTLFAKGGYLNSFDSMQFFREVASYSSKMSS